MSIGKALQEILKPHEEGYEVGVHPLSNRTRRAVLRELTRKPCQTATAVATKLGANVQNVQWHLKKLEEYDFVKSFKKSRIRYYPAELISAEDLDMFSLIAGKNGWLVVKSLLSRCREINFLSRHMGKSTAYRILAELKKNGYVEEIRSSRAIYCLSDKFHSKLEYYDKRGLEFRKIFLKKIELRGYRVEIVGTVNYETKIRIEGYEKFTVGIFISPLRTALEVR